MNEGDLAFRRAMGGFATGVAVISAARGDGGVCGITVNSLASVSLQPRLILWCLGDQSARYELFSTAARWGVSVLAADGEALARRFAKPETAWFEAGEAETLGEAPTLRGALLRLGCRTVDSLSSGDHLILVGEVLAFQAGRGDALSFYRGRYGRIADPEQEP